jgi:alpha/beta hydrolase fold
MKRGIIVLLSLCVVLIGGYFSASKWAIYHRTVTFYDLLRDDRPITIDIAVRRDRELEATAGLITLPVAVLNHGNMVMSIQHDLDSDEPMVTKVGEDYVGRQPQYNRGVANILYAIEQMKKIQPNADYKHLAMVGHSNGGDISMYFAKHHPDLIKKVVTLDNLRVPFITNGKFKILSFRSTDPVFKTDPGVVPDDDICQKAGITVVKTGYQHTDMSDRGPDNVKTTIQTMVDKFLDDDDRDTPAEGDKPATDKPAVAGPSALSLTAAQAKN